MQRHFLAEPENESFESEMARMGPTLIPGRNPIPRDQLVSRRVEAIVQFPESMNPELRHALEDEFRSRGYTIVPTGSTIGRHMSYTTPVNADVGLEEAEAATREHPESVRQAIHEARQQTARTMPYTPAFNADVAAGLTPAEQFFLSSNQPGRLDEALALAEAQSHHHPDFDAPVEPINLQGAETTLLADPEVVTVGTRSTRSSRGRGQTQPKIRSRMNGLATPSSPRKKSPSAARSPARGNRGTVAVAAAVSPRQRKKLESSLQAEGYTVMTPQRK
jgi:hypothetical protein